MPTHILLSILIAIMSFAVGLVAGAPFVVAVLLAAVGSTVGILIGRIVPPPEPIEMERRPARPQPRQQRTVSRT